MAISDGAGGDASTARWCSAWLSTASPACPAGSRGCPKGSTPTAVSDWARNDFDGAGLHQPLGRHADRRRSLEYRRLDQPPPRRGLLERRRRRHRRGPAPGDPQPDEGPPAAQLHLERYRHLEHPRGGRRKSGQFSSQILALYPNVAYTKFGGGTGPYNREHSWPQSYGFPDEGATNSPRTDCHHLFLDQVESNGDRGNKPFGTCNAGCTQIATVSNHGHGGQGGGYPGDSNWYTGPDGPTGIMEVWNHRRGDVARAQLYMDIRYDAGNHAATGFAEPDLILTDNTGQIASTGGEPSRWPTWAAWPPCCSGTSRIRRTPTSATATTWCGPTRATATPSSTIPNGSPASTRTIAGPRRPPISAITVSRRGGHRDARRRADGLHHPGYERRSRRRHRRHREGRLSRRPSTCSWTCGASAGSSCARRARAICADCGEPARRRHRHLFGQLPDRQLRHRVPGQQRGGRRAGGNHRSGRRQQQRHRHRYLDPASEPRHHQKRRRGHRDPEP